jgi:hypothetical protein
VAPVPAARLSVRDGARFGFTRADLATHRASMGCRCERSSTNRNGSSGSPRLSHHKRAPIWQPAVRAGGRPVRVPQLGPWWFVCLPPRPQKPAPRTYKGTAMHRSDHRRRAVQRENDSLSAVARELAMPRDAPFVFLCQCHDAFCNEYVKLTLAEYDAQRREKRVDSLPRPCSAARRTGSGPIRLAPIDSRCHGPREPVTILRRARGKLNKRQPSPASQSRLVGLRFPAS